MTGYLKQIYRDNDPVGLYLFPKDVDDETISLAYQRWIDHPEFEGEFEDWWNTTQPFVQIERVFTSEIFIP